MAARAIQQPQTGSSGRSSYPSDPVPENLSAQFNTARTHPQAQSFGGSFTSTSRAGIQTTTIGADFSSNSRVVHTRQGFGSFVMPVGTSLSSVPVPSMPMQFGGPIQQPGSRAAPVALQPQPQYDDCDMDSYNVALSSNLPSLPTDSAKERLGSKTSSSKGKAKAPPQANTLDAFVKRSSALRPTAQPSLATSVSATTLGVAATTSKSTTTVSRPSPQLVPKPFLPTPAPKLPRTAQFTATRQNFGAIQSHTSATATAKLAAPSFHGPATAPATAPIPSTTPPDPTVPRKRLGMGHVAGYVNKRFKSHHLDASSS